MEKLERRFYERDAREVAKDLLGKVLVNKVDGSYIMGRIVETEAYIGAIDKAAHCYNNKKTERTKIMFGPPGFAYVYLIYGMYYCLNVVTDKDGTCAAVLIRALEPIGGLDRMALNRYNIPFDKLNKRQIMNLTSGPGKLCKALGIDINFYGEDLTGDKLFICDDGFKDFEILKTKRINIDYAEEAADFLWRYIIKGNPYVSR